MQFGKFKKIKNNKALLNGVLFSLFSFINKGFSFLIVLILANYISPSEYGYLSLFVTVVMIIGYFIALSTEGFLSVSYFRIGEKGLKQTISSILFIATIFSVLLIFIIGKWGMKLEKIFQLDTNVLYFAVEICFFTVFSNILLDFFRLQNRIKIYGVVSCSNALFNFLSTIFLVKYVHLGWMSRVYSQSACFTIYGIFAILYFFKIGYVVFPHSEFLKKMILWGLPIIPHLATGFIRQGCDRYIINYYHSINEVGLFSFALNLSNIIVMIGIGFNQSNSIEIFKLLGDKLNKNKLKLQMLFLQRKQIMKIYSLASIIIMVLGYVVFPIIIPKYALAMNYFILLSICGFLQCLYFLYTNYLFYYDKTKNIMYITFITSIIHLMLSLMLTRYSLYYTCFIYILSQFFILVLIRHKAISVLNKNLN